MSGYVREARATCGSWPLHHQPSAVGPPGGPATLPPMPHQSSAVVKTYLLLRVSPVGIMRPLYFWPISPTATLARYCEGLTPPHMQNTIRTSYFWGIWQSPIHVDEGNPPGSVCITTPVQRAGPPKGACGDGWSEPALDKEGRRLSRRPSIMLQSCLIARLSFILPVVGSYRPPSAPPLRRNDGRFDEPSVSSDLSGSREASSASLTVNSKQAPLSLKTLMSPP